MRGEVRIFGFYNNKKKNCRFSENKVARFYNKKAGKSFPVASKHKLAENLHRNDHHRPKIGLNPNFLGYSNSP